MEIWPHGAYEEQMPDSNLGRNLSGYWNTVGSYLYNAIIVNERANQAKYRKETDGDRQ